MARACFPPWLGESLCELVRKPRQAINGYIAVLGELKTVKDY